MNKKQLWKMLEELGVKEVIEYEKNVQIPCLLAKWRFGHTKGSDHAGSMGISFNDKGKPSLVNCFACQFKGNLSYLLFKYAQLSGKNIQKIRDWVDDIEEGDPIQMVLDIRGFDERDGEESHRVDILCEGLLNMHFESGYRPEVLAKRGLEDDTLGVWECMYDRRFNRFVFPVREMQKSIGYSCFNYLNLVGAVGRSVVGKKRYHNYFNFPTSRYFLGEHLAKKDTVAVVVEGVVDTISVWQEIHRAGRSEEYSVLGLLGTEVSGKREKFLCDNFKSVVAFFDNDPAGWTGQRKLIVAIQDRTLLRGVRYPRVAGYVKSDPAKLVEDGVDVISLIDNAGLIAV